MSQYITPTSVLQYIERHLGFGFNELELSPEDILTTIRQESLPQFSKSYPYMIYYLLDTVSNDYKVPGYDNRYYIRIKNMPNEPIGVSQVYLSTNYFGDLAGLGYSSAITSNGSEAQLIADNISANRVPITHEYYPEDNSFSIYPGGYTNTNLLVKIKAVHNEDFSSIPFNMRDNFLLLCLYDVQISLLPLRRRFANLQTALGNIELFIDDLTDATSKREELLDKFRKNILKAPNRKKIYIY